MHRPSRLSALRINPAADNARSLRASLTDVEHRLWYHLRDRRLNGFKFRRQVPLGNYVVDFLCEEARLIVEADGGQHAERIAQDASRTEWLALQGYRVVRYWNNDVLENVDGVLEDLLKVLHQKNKGQT